MVVLSRCPLTENWSLTCNNHTWAFLLVKTRICEASPARELRDGELILDQTRKLVVQRWYMKEGLQTDQPGISPSLHLE